MKKVLSCTLTIQTNKYLSLATEVHSHSPELAFSLLAPFTDSLKSLAAMVCSCQAGLQTVLGMLKSRASPSCVRRWGATPHTPRRQLRASMEAWPAEFETHRVTCGHCQPEVVTSESRELPEHRASTAVKRQPNQATPMERQQWQHTWLS